MPQFVPDAFQPPHLHFTLVAAGLFLIPLYFFFKRFAAYYSQLRRKWNPPAPFDARLMQYHRGAAFFWLLILIPAALLLALAVYLGSYQLLSQNAVIAGRADFHGSRVQFQPPDLPPANFSVRGGRAAIAGIFLKFPGWTRYAGLHTYHRVITARGSDDFQYHYAQPPPDWMRQHADRLFCFLYAQRKWIGVVEPAYRESPYFGRGRHRIFVTHSGYIVN